MSPTRSAPSLEEALEVVERAQALPVELADFGPARAEVLEHEATLVYSNPDAGPQQIADALLAWRIAQARERKAEAERGEAFAERRRQRALCRRCGQRPGSQRTLLGPSGLKEQIVGGFGTSARLCAPCAAGVEYAVNKLVYELDADDYDRFAQRVVSGDRTGLT